MRGPGFFSGFFWRPGVAIRICGSEKRGLEGGIGPN